MADADKMTVTANVNGEQVQFEVVKMTVREPITGLLVDMKMTPAPSVPFVYGYTPGQVEAAVREAVKGIDWFEADADSVYQAIMEQLNAPAPSQQ